MRYWKLIGAATLALLALVACNGDGAAPEDGTPAGTPAATATGTPAETPITLSGTPVVCVDVEPVPQESSIDPAEVVPLGKIAFVSFRDEYEGTPNREIYLMSSDGTGPINLTHNSCADDEPDLSPDGTKIAWSSDRDGDFEIYVMNADGSDATQLTTQGSALSPRWSPDGERITYARGGTIDVINADGSDLVTVLRGKSESAAAELCEVGGFPGGWSPDGARIVYYAPSVSTGVGHVCTVAVDGGVVETLVSEPPVYNVEPVWSPDGKNIAFRSIRDDNHDIYVVNLEDGSERRLTEGEALDIEPDWSPDGEWIVFGSSRDAINTDIYVMRADGSDVRRLTEHPAKDSYPVWSP